MISLRDYQKKAIEIALNKKKVVIVMPTGTGKTYVALGLLKRINIEGKKVIIEPTRYLVEQTYNFSKKFFQNFLRIYGIKKKEERIKLWKKAEYVITTPETLYNDREFVNNISVLILDECHHAIGNDPYMKILNYFDPQYKIGLTAFIPKKYKKHFEEKIGEIVIFSYKDLKSYIPNWIGDVFESPFNKEEFSFYKKLEKKYYQEIKNRIYYYLAMKYFSVDGFLALKESYKKNKNFRIFELPNFRDMHKLDVLKRILKIYEFEKAIIFVDRRIIASELSKIFKATLIIGRSKNIEEILENARKNKIIISTSAGEEGVDLPTADLLVVWSNTSNPLRFIQRQGRLLRKINDKIKYAVYIITPYTIDTHLFLKSVYLVKDYIDLRISEDTLKKLYNLSPYSLIKDLLKEPLYFEYLKQYFKISENDLRKYLRFYLDNGEIIYIYTPYDKLYILSNYIYVLEEKYKSYLVPKYEGIIKINSKKITGDFKKLLNYLKDKLPISKLVITKIIKHRDLIEYHPYKYDFLIKNKKVLEIVIKNALS